MILVININAIGFGFVPRNISKRFKPVNLPVSN
jgi:hypothetical protein